MLREFPRLVGGVLGHKQNSQEVELTDGLNILDKKE